MADINEMRNKFFQARRDEASRQAASQEQQADDMLKRRFTAMGQGMGSGAAMGATLKSQQDVAAQKQAAMNDLATQEMGSLEAEAGRQFQAGESKLGREFAGAESKLGREFAGAESRLGREFQSGLADKDAALKREFFATEQGNKLKQLDLAERQFAMDKDVTEFNKRMAEIEGKGGKGLLGSKGGLLGSGIGGDVGAGYGQYATMGLGGGK